LAVKALAVLLSVFGAAAVAAGVGLVYLPAGVVAGGVELLAAAYVIGYLEARR
jgi:hypothetical protein